MEKPIKCPCCDSVLIVTHRERYQDLMEHVSDPNGTPSMKDGYQCPNKECIANMCGVTWIEDGDYYTGKRPEGISYSELNRRLEEKYGTACAVDSWNFHYELGKKAIKKKTWKINLYWYKFVFPPREKGWDYPIEKRHQPNMWKWKIEIWKKSSDYGHTNVIPFWIMMRYVIRGFKNNYKNWKETGSERSRKDAINEATGISSWGSIDTRFYARMSKIWIQMFYPKKVKELLKSQG